MRAVVMRAYGEAAAAHQRLESAEGFGRVVLLPR